MDKSLFQPFQPNPIFTMPTTLLNVLDLKTNDPIAFTFFTGYMAMLAASVFFFAERSAVEGKWKLSLLVSALITGIAAIHYYYMRDYYLATGKTPTALRYIDWTLTVPLMCVEFYLLTKAAGAKISLLWKLIAASVFMLVTGYIGEAFYNGPGEGTQSIIWGSLSTLGYIYILYTAWAGEVAQLAKASGDAIVIKGIRALAWFVLVGWAIYPIGYMCMPGNLLSSFMAPSSVDLFYNIADAINKIGFGLVVYGIAVSGKSAAAVNETMPTANAGDASRGAVRPA